LIILANSVVIIGANRGIGLGFVKHYLKHEWVIHATKRDRSKSAELDALSNKIQIYSLDVQNIEQLSILKSKIKDTPVDLLIHNAGTYGTGLKEEQVIDINSESPIKLTNTLLPNILNGRIKKVAILTSQMGARNGGPTPTGLYGKSKCYLNDNFRAIEPEWRSKGITSVLFHPGWVATDMGGANAPVSVEDSVEGMKSVIDNLTIRDSGKFYTWKGDIHPW
tara:strand:+ start:49 stop:714 length:666 start_codon:yes stop_codon:yes gene_type:complete